MSDYLDTLAYDTKKTIAEDYYKISNQPLTQSISLRKAIIDSQKNPVITEIKAASPSKGIIKASFEPVNIARAMINGGAVGISVLTEPKHFKGSLKYLAEIREAINAPILMKDFIISPIQIETAAKLGANVVLLIEALFEREYTEYSLDEMIKEAHSKHLEVLLETHKEHEFRHAIETDADLVGINNRDLRTLKINLKTTERILKKNESNGKVVISESGVMKPSDLVFLRKCGAQAFLIGSSVMMAENVEQKVKEFVTAY